VTTRAAHERGSTLPLLFFGVFAPPLAWTARLLIAYALVPLACDTSTNLWLHAVSGAMLAVSVAAGAVSYFGWRRSRTPEDAPLSAERYRWASLFGLFMSAVFSLAIVLESASNFVVDPCQRSV
jgi:hypothetical protein